MPPFCPNPGCPFHCTPSGWPFKKSGFFTRKHCQPPRIQRYRCLHCNRNFSSQTFSTTYWLHRPELQTRIFHRIQACSGLRQIADEYGVSPSTIKDHLSRLGRNCLLFQHLHRPQVMEPLVLDGFESFEYSQYFPFHFNVLVGKHSHFFYLFTDSPLRRKGRMTERQRLRRAQLEHALGRPDPRSIQKEVEELLRLTLANSPTLTLHSDDHPAYPRALRALAHLTVQHHVTPSTDRRTPQNPLFPVNLLDLLIRHGGANHKRETIAFSKRRQGAIERLAILQVWRNFVRPFSKRRRGPTPAQRAGVMDRRLEVKVLLGRRLFASRIRLPERLERYYRRGTQTAALRANRSHRLQYAY